MNLKKLKLLAVTSCLFIGMGCASSGSDKIRLADLSENATPAEIAFHYGMRAYIEDDYEEAGKYFREATALDSSASGAEVNLAITLERTGKWDEAASVYRKVFNRDSRSVAAALNVARTLVQVKRYGAASEVLKKCLEHQPEEAALLNALTESLRHQKKYPEAIEAARRVLLRDQDNVRAIKNIGLIYMDEGKLTLSATFFHNAQKLLKKKDPSIVVSLGLMAARRGDLQRALFHFEQALNLDPTNGAAHSNIGAISLKHRDYKRAEQAYLKSVEAGLGGSCDIMAALGYSLEGQQRGEEAIKQLQTAYERCPNETKLLWSMGNICMAQLRDNECALEKFEAFVKNTPNLPGDHPVHVTISGVRESMAADDPNQESAPPPSEEPSSPDDTSSEDASANRGYDPEKASRNQVPQAKLSAG
ncbi:MAG: tetratricopeptide repeat protein [Myxococcota bacterium]|nr:tetratricopeptide repeat protein [Myxococcota bacterium]